MSEFLDFFVKQGVIQEEYVENLKKQYIEKEVKKLKYYFIQGKRKGIELARQKSIEQVKRIREKQSMEKFNEFKKYYVEEGIKIGKSQLEEEVLTNCKNNLLEKGICATEEEALKEATQLLEILVPNSHED